MARVLRRCSICQRYHASFLVDDPELGRLLLCKDCWKARHAAPHSEPEPPPPQATEAGKPGGDRPPS